LKRHLQKKEGPDGSQLTVKPFFQLLIVELNVIEIRNAYKLIIGLIHSGIEQFSIRRICNRYTAVPLFPEIKNGLRYFKRQ